MAKYVSQFWFVLTLICSYPLAAQDALALQFRQEAENQQLYNNGNSEVSNRVLQALSAYQNEDYSLALSYLDQAINLSNHDNDLVELKKSVERLAIMRQVADGEKVKEKKITLDRNPEGERFTDKNRFLLQALVGLDTNLNNFNSVSGSRMSMSGSLEGFLPQLDRSLGLYVGFNGQFFDIDNAVLAPDYQLWEYKVALQWRFAWSLPALEQRVSLAVRLGLAGQEARMIIPNSSPDSYLLAFNLPLLEIALQDPLLSHIWKNVFTQNLLFSPLLSVAWWPTGKNPTALFKVGIGIRYNFAGFSFGPAYHFRYQYSFKSNKALQSHIWSLLLGYTW